MRIFYLEPKHDTKSDCSEAESRPRTHTNDGRVVSNFIVQALKGDPITIYGDGKQTRSFCYVDDLLDGCVRLMENTGPQETGPINLGNPFEFTMLALAETVIRQTDSSSKIEFRPLPEDEPRQRQPDIRRAKETLGWNPRWKLEDGLEPTIAYFRKLVD
jgi:UDP-glucuronate decarboxylase